MILIILFMVNFSIMFVWSKHPISMGIILLLQTMMTSILMNMMLQNAWFSYILLLVMIGGLLILFIYMTSLASNEKFKFNPMILIMNFMFMIMLTMANLLDKFNFDLQVKSWNMFNYTLNLNFNKFFIFPSIMIMAIMIIYLLIVLIAIVKISSFKSGPLRQKI